MQTLDESTVCERLDAVFGREWNHKTSYVRCATFVFPGAVGENGTDKVSLHFWRTKCDLDIPLQDGKNVLNVTGDHMCTSDEHGAFLLNHKASFLTTALRELGVGSDDARIMNSYLSHSPSVSVLYLTGFDTTLRKIAIVERKSDLPVFSFLEFRSISDLLLRVYRIESMMLIGEGEDCCQHMNVYLLTLDHRGIALLSEEDLPLDAAFEIRLDSYPSLALAVDSVQKTSLTCGVSFYYLNFDHFLSEKTINILRSRWGNERRAQVRIQRTLPVKIALSRYKSLHALTSDISLSGMRIVHKHSIPPGMHFDCQVRLATVHGDIELKSMLVWKKTLMSTLNITGVQFIQHNTEELQRLRDYLESEIVKELRTATEATVD